MMEKYTPILTHIRRMRSIFETLVSDVTDDGPRIDVVEVAKSLYTLRPMSLARKQEDIRPTILVMVDVSGSCAGFTDKSLPVAAAASRLGVPGADVIVVVHSNGYPIAVELNGKSIPIDEHDSLMETHDKETVQFWQDLLRDRMVEVVLHLGDWDAVWLFPHMLKVSHVKRFIWLDNYACNQIDPRVDNSEVKNNDILSTFTGKIVRVVGCSDVDDLFSGIHLAVTRI